jgi:hypothetical protein
MGMEGQHIQPNLFFMSLLYILLTDKYINNIHKEQLCMSLYVSNVRAHLYHGSIEKVNIKKLRI